MGFHRLAVPSYFGGLPGGYDYINNAISGTPAGADVAKVGGPNAGTYFTAFGEDATSANTNRANQALAQNTDFIDDLLHRDLAVPTRTGDTTPGAPVSSVTITGPGIFLGGVGDALQDLFHITDTNDNDIEVTGSKVVVSSISSGGALGSGFSAGNVTVALSPSIPTGQAYRLWYGQRSNLATLPSDAFTTMRVRSAVQVDAVTEELFRLLHGNNEVWNAAWDTDIYTINQVLTVSGVTSIRQVADPATLRAIGSGARPANVAAVIPQLGLFTFVSTRFGTDDSRYIIKPTDIVGSAAGRWVSLAIAGVRAAQMTAVFNWADSLTSPANTNLGKPFYDATLGEWWIPSYTKLYQMTGKSTAQWNTFNISGTVNAGNGAASPTKVVLGENDISGAPNQVTVLTKATTSWATSTFSVSGGVVPQHVLVDYEPVNALFLVFYSSSASGNEYSVNTSPDGITWTLRTLPAAFNTSVSVATHMGVGNGRAVVAGPTDSNIVHVAVANMSSPGSWTDVAMTSALVVSGTSDPVYNPSDGTWIILVYGTQSATNKTEVWRSQDDGATWTRITTIAASNVFLSSVAAQGEVWIAHDDVNLTHTTAYSTDSGATWNTAGWVIGHDTVGPVRGGGGSFIHALPGNGSVGATISKFVEPAYPTAIT